MDRRHLVIPADTVLRLHDSAADPVLQAEQLLVVVLRSGAQLQLPAGLTGAIVPLIGQVVLATPESSMQIGRGEVACPDSDRPVDVRCVESGLCVAVLASQRLWVVAAAGCDGAPRVEPVLLPGVHELPPALREAATQALAGADADAYEAIADARTWLLGLCALQMRFESFVARCPGRTVAARRRVFQRLERVRAFIRGNMRASIKVEGLAKIANYTLAHFIRLFSTVYGETPYAFGLNCRIERARPLIVSTDLSIEEIARAVGFDCRTSFYRAFRMRFGCSASTLRARARGDRREAA